MKNLNYYVLCLFMVLNISICKSEEIKTKNDKTSSVKKNEEAKYSKYFKDPDLASLFEHYRKIRKMGGKHARYTSFTAVTEAFIPLINIGEIINKIRIERRSYDAFLKNKIDTYSFGDNEYSLLNDDWLNFLSIGDMIIPDEDEDESDLNESKGSEKINILFMSDGPSFQNKKLKGNRINDEQVSLMAECTKKSFDMVFSEEFNDRVMIYKTDILIKKDEQGPNENGITYVHMDNSKDDLPELLKDIKFDLIHGLRLLCHCPSFGKGYGQKINTCGGVICDDEFNGPKKFLMLVSSLLREKESSVAVLQGKMASGEPCAEEVSYWKSVLKNLSDLGQWRVDLVSNKKYYSFLGLLISSKKGCHFLNKANQVFSNEL